MRSNHRRPPRQPRIRREHLEKRLRSAQRSVSRGRLKAGSRRALQVAAEIPADLSILNRVGDLLVRAKRTAAGIELFERIGRAYAADGFWAKAIAIYKKILRHDPGRRDIEAHLAELYQRSGLPISVGALC